jgi:probable F420-dependent oxidoreductase
MKFATTLMGVRMRALGEAAQSLESVGFESIWIPEHLAMPVEFPATYPYTESGLPPVPAGTPCYNPFVLLSYIACATSTIRLATNVCILPLHHPLRTARDVVTLDRLSGGRVTLGVGVGWMRDEFDWIGEDFHNRGKRADEIIEILRRLWSEDVVEYESANYRFGPVHFQPKPLQRPILPIEIGGTSPAALRRAALLGDGWIEIGSADIDEIARRIAHIRRMREEAGRDSYPFEITVGGEWAKDVDNLRRVADAGATRVLAWPASSKPLDAPDVAQWAARFRDEVIEPMHSHLDSV